MGIFWACRHFFFSASVWHQPMSWRCRSEKSHKKWQNICPAWRFVTLWGENEVRSCCHSVLNFVGLSDTLIDWPTDWASIHATFSQQRRAPERPHHHRHAGNRHGLVHQVPRLRRQEDSRLRARWGWRHDWHTGSPGPVHPDTEVTANKSSCSSRKLLVGLNTTPSFSSEPGDRTKVRIVAYYLACDTWQEFRQERLPDAAVFRDVRRSSDEIRTGHHQQPGRDSAQAGGRKLRQHQTGQPTTANLPRDGVFVLRCRGLQKDCQMLLFSATYDENVIQFAEAIVPNAVTIRLRREEETLENIKQVSLLQAQHACRWRGIRSSCCSSWCLPLHTKWCSRRPVSSARHPCNSWHARCFRILISSVQC